MSNQMRHFRAMRMVRYLFDKINVLIIDDTIAGEIQEEKVELVKDEILRLGIEL